MKRPGLWPLAAACVVGLWLVPALGQAPAAAADVVAVQAGRLIDGTSTSVRERATILIKGDRITAVQDGWQAPAGAKVIDLRTSTVMPGLIDAHTHITGEGTANAIVKAATETPLDAAVRSTVYARRTLEAGFTTIRNVGAEGGADVALKRAIEAGIVPGPRIWTARTTISITGGHGDQGGLRPDLWKAPTWEDGIVDSADEARKAVRYQHKYGADLIKITATGGVLSIGDSGDAQQFTDEEMRAIVEAAHLLGMKVAAHAHGKRGIEAAIRAGVDSIEHGTYSDDATFALFKAHGTCLVPTIIAGKTRRGDGHDSRPSSPERPGEGRAHRSAHAGHVQARVRGRREDCVRHRLGRVEPRRQCARVPVHGRSRHAADRSHSLGHPRRRRPDWRGRSHRIPAARPVRRSGGGSGEPADRHHGNAPGDVRDEGRRDRHVCGKIDRT